MQNILHFSFISFIAVPYQWSQSPPIPNQDYTSQFQSILRKSEIKVMRLHFALYFWFLLPSFLHSLRFSEPSFSCYRCTVKAFVLLSDFFPPVFSAPCRIQWHSFLMRLLSLLISVSFSEMNDSRPCNKYNMRCINFSENKNERPPLLYPFQMFRFMAFPMSASFSKFEQKYITISLMSN